MPTLVTSHINMELMMDRLSLSYDQISESLTVSVPTLKNKDNDVSNKFVAKKVNSLARSKGMVRSYELLVHLLEETSNHLERCLTIKKLSRYFLTEEGIAEFFTQDRRSFVYGSQTVPSQAWKSFIVDDYRILLKRLGIMQP